MNKDLSELQKILKVVFKELGFLELALTHKSFAQELGLAGLAHNERLEFLGDAVLELIISRHLYENFPKAPEGTLTHWRSVLVNTKSLAHSARQLQLDKFIRLSRGERDSKGAEKESILAGVFEAVLGAVYLDQGWEAAQKLVARVLLKQLPESLEVKPQHNPKGYFQEKAQGILNITPCYKVLEESGPDHAKEFRVGVYLDDSLIAEGKGASKQEAESRAAEAALKIKGWG
jgi:ribonuclease-3